MKCNNIYMRILTIPYNKLLCYFIFAICFFQCGCSFQEFQKKISTEKIIINLTSVNSETSKCLKIVWIDECENVQEIFISELNSNEEQSKITLTLCKNSVTPILVYYDNTKNPFGFIYPYEQEISFYGGFSSRILFRLLTDTYEKFGSKKQIRQYCNYFNWEKFNEKIKAFEDPWELNQLLILESIGNASFSTYTLQKSR